MLGIHDIFLTDIKIVEVPNERKKFYGYRVSLEIYLN